MSGTYESGYDPKYGYNRNAFAHKTLSTAILGKTVKLIATPIGLISEAIHHNKDKNVPTSNKEPIVDAAESSTYVTVLPEQADELIATGQAELADGQKPTHELIPENEVDDDLERDERDWALDEAIVYEPAPANEEVETVETMIQDIQPIKAIPSSQKSAYKLPFPVILPQRRPGTKARGFVRAYAPALQESGINQEMFLSFLKNFHKAAQASPIFEVVKVASVIAGINPNPLVGLGALAVQVAAGIGQEIQERYRLNKFLNQANRDIFVPKGLYVLIVTYQPGTNDKTEVGTKTVDLGATAVAKFGEELITPESKETSEAEVEGQEKGKIDEMKEKMKQLRISSGVSHGEAEMPVTCAPLVFPALDSAAADSGEGSSSFKAKSKSSSKFVANYFDRRAQATYAVNNPNSTLTTQVSSIAPEFKSRYADPENHTNKHLFTLLTGGKWKAEPLGARRRWERAQRKEAEKRAQGIKEKPRKRMLQENVLYLMVVNMPTKQELEDARKTLATSQK